MRFVIFHFLDFVLESIRFSIAIIITVLRSVGWCVRFGPTLTVQAYLRRPVRNFYRMAGDVQRETVCEQFARWSATLPQGRPGFKLVFVPGENGRIPLNSYLREIAENRYPIATGDYFGRSVFRVVTAVSTHEACWRKLQSAAHWALQLEDFHPELRSITVDEAFVREWNESQANAVEKMIAAIDAFKSLKLSDDEKNSLRSALPEYVARVLRVSAQIEGIENVFWWDSAADQDHYFNLVRALPGKPVDVHAPEVNAYFAFLAMLRRRERFF